MKSTQSMNGSENASWILSESKAWHKVAKAKQEFLVFIPKTTMVRSRFWCCWNPVWAAAYPSVPLIALLILFSTVSHSQCHNAKPIEKNLYPLWCKEKSWNWVWVVCLVLTWIMWPSLWILLFAESVTGD